MFDGIIIILLFSITYELLMINNNLAGIWDELHYDNEGDRD